MMPWSEDRGPQKNGIIICFLLLIKGCVVCILQSCYWFIYKKVVIRTLFLINVFPSDPIQVVHTHPSVNVHREGLQLIATSHAC